MSYCGYIDILGTKALADHAIDELREHMDYFHSSLHDNFEYYKNGTCIAASDGAFYENIDKDEFYPYYRRVRNFLFDKGVFFKCSYMPGKIGPILEPQGGPIDLAAPAFLSINFSDQSSKAYRAEARLRGIGCTIEEFGKSSEEKPSNTILNFYMQKQGGKFVPVAFIDFNFSIFEVSENGEHCAEWEGQQRLLDRILFYTSISTINSDDIALKFIPLLVNAVRSSSYSGIYAEGNKWIRAPYIIRRLITSNSPITQISRIPGINLILLSIYDKIYSDNLGEIQEKAEEKILRFISRRRDCQKNLGDTPNFVIKPPAKKKLLRKLAEYRGINPPKDTE
ncbi:hypothetical protein [Rhizobium halophytocola]|uniref:Uncharacterized protein n=1 Tax=Rhizobium halophytocola TaxID=735519 RepID=A0ABS4E3D2_9HYPH|nr:hypothetical protein [Rhizobium halophytocola]MBP1852424.1 hypothetical protein [Rhizobium halophytocola]